MLKYFFYYYTRIDFTVLPLSTGETKKRIACEVPFSLSLAFVLIREGVAPAFRKRGRVYHVCSGMCAFQIAL
jgi:hypothetical protein